MKNAKLKIKNEGEDGKLENGNGHMFVGGSVPSASGAAQVHGLKFKVDPVRNFEDLRLKKRFRTGHLINRGSRGRAGLMRHSVASRMKCFGPGCCKMGRSMNHWPGRGGYLVEIPLSPSLSPLVPHGERENLCKHDFRMSGCSGASSPSGTACAWSGGGGSLISTCCRSFHNKNNFSRGGRRRSGTDHRHLLSGRTGAVESGTKTEQTEDPRIILSGAAGCRGQTRLNSLKLARTLVPELFFELKMKRRALGFGHSLGLGHLALGIFSRFRSVSSGFSRLDGDGGGLPNRAGVRKVFL